jgi:hypothetical protein
VEHAVLEVPVKVVKHFLDPFESIMEPVQEVVTKRSGHFARCVTALLLVFHQFMRLKALLFSRGPRADHFRPCVVF